jgi:hypothetical protein
MSFLLQALIEHISRKHRFGLLAAVVASYVFYPVLAQAPLNQSIVPPSEIKAVEQRLLQKTFDRDPVAKRLQRLELLLFGSTQYGSNYDRWQDIQLALKQRQGYLSKGFEANGPRVAAAGKRASAVAQLERQVLKKNYPGESVSGRLNRLERKLFGQSSPAMSIDRRIDRLEKTTGIAGTDVSPPTAMLPMPGDGRDHSPFFGPFSSRPFENFGGPGLANPFDMLREMDKQMREFNKQFQDDNGTLPNLPMHPNFPDNGQYKFRYYYFGPDGQIQPAPAPKNGRPKIPNRPGQAAPGQKLPRFEDIPPYSDPNMI